VKERAAFKNAEANEMFSEALLERLQNPGQSFMVERIGNCRVLDCNINYDFHANNEHQLTFIFFPGKVVSVTTLGQILSDDLGPRDVIDPERAYDANLVILTLFRRLLDRNASLANKFTKKVDALLKISIAQSFDTTPDELEKLHSRAIDLNELFEDQLTTIRLLPMNIEEDNQVIIGFLDRVEKSMEYLVQVTERSQDKLDYILQRYANVLQQKANARLNTLTIVQAIFVPLTFLAGIYGMNFVNMPELEAESGYFYILGLMGVIGLGGLYLFYRNGWFNSK
jgi:Mg2+ and Co2+ transporter CorA